MSRFDDLFMTIAHEQKDIEGLLDTFFDFLNRKTDFYVVSKDPSRKQMGFLPGQAEQLMLKSMRKFSFRDVDLNQSFQDKENKTREHNKVVIKDTTTTTNDTHNPITLMASTKTLENKQNQGSISETNKSKPMTSLRVELTDKGKQLPIANGGSTDRYTWTQSLEDVTIYVNLPSGTTSKDVVCKLTSSNVSISLKNGSKSLLEGNFPGKIRKDESIWSIEPNHVFTLSLEKIKKTWWACALEGDDEIDTSRVDSTVQLHEYDPPTQGAIRKIMFDQAQKAKGLPTSDDLIQEDILSKAKRLPNSPFFTCPPASFTDEDT